LVDGKRLKVNDLLEKTDFEIQGQFFCAIEVSTSFCYPDEGTGFMFSKHNLIETNSVSSFVGMTGTLKKTKKYLLLIF
jgi:hypothetical protein